MGAYKVMVEVVVENADSPEEARRYVDGMLDYASEIGYGVGGADNDPDGMGMSFRVGRASQVPVKERASWGLSGCACSRRR